MAQNTRELRRRIKATKSIRQITKAMEMIAASKMRKAQLAALASRPYANLAWEMLSSLQGKGEYLYANKKLAKFLNSNVSTANSKTLVILITSNRGLCGSLNTQLVNEALRVAGADRDNHLFIVIGRKGAHGLLRAGMNLHASFDGFENQLSIAEIRPIASAAIETFTKEDFSRALVVYADFISTIQYKTRVRQLLPVTEKAILYSQEGIQLEIGKENRKGLDAEILFEPSPAEVLEELIPRLTELQLYQFIVENLASEHSARMLNMKNASDSAGDIINDLTLTYNSARQASITADLADIIGGRMAIR